MRRTDSKTSTDFYRLCLFSEDCRSTTNVTISRKWETYREGENYLASILTICSRIRFVSLRIVFPTTTHLPPPPSITPCNVKNENLNIAKIHCTYEGRRAQGKRRIQKKKGNNTCDRALTSTDLPSDKKARWRQSVDERPPVTCTH